MNGETKPVQIRMPVKLWNMIKQVAQKQGYSSASEWARHRLRTAAEQEKKLK